MLLDARPLSSSQLDSLGLLKARDGRTSLTMLSPICQSFTLDSFHAEVLELNLNPSAISTVDAAMPGWGLLFEEREHLLQMIHLSLREFLLDSDRSGSYAADVRRGHILLAQSCLRNLLERTTGPTLAYALRHGHVCHGLYVKSWHTCTSHYSHCSHCPRVASCPRSRDLGSVSRVDWRRSI